MIRVFWTIDGITLWWLNENVQWITQRNHRSVWQMLMFLRTSCRTIDFTRQRFRIEATLEYFSFFSYSICVSFLLSGTLSSRTLICLTTSCKYDFFFLLLPLRLMRRNFVFSSVFSIMIFYFVSIKFFFLHVLLDKTYWKSMYGYRKKWTYGLPYEFFCLWIM